MRNKCAANKMGNELTDCANSRGKKRNDHHLDDLLLHKMYASQMFTTNARTALATDTIP